MSTTPAAAAVTIELAPAADGMLHVVSDEVNMSFSTMEEARRSFRPGTRFRTLPVVLPVPSAELAKMLDAAEAMWRVAVTLDAEWAPCYQIADRALSDLLDKAFGSYAGARVRAEMADNLEGWSYNRGIVNEQNAFAASLCDWCGWSGYEHGTDCKHA